MDELDAGRELDMPVAVVAVAAQPRRRDREQGTHPLAAGTDQMICELGNQRDRGAHTHDDLAVDTRHVIGAEPQERFETGRLALAFEGDDGCHDGRLNSPIKPVIATR
jgi:hypothetical protein